jgi:hypothetical protein
LEITDLSDGGNVLVEIKKILCLFFLSFVAATMILPACSQERDSASTKDSPVGDWRGMSICQVKPSSCHDEDSLYHFKPGSKSGTFELQADKIVNGKPLTMGTSPCNYDAAGQLVCPVTQGGPVLFFVVKGDEMQGTMKMPDGTIWRRLTLKRVQQH